MQIFIKIEDYELWNIVTKGSYVPLATIDEKVVEKTEDQYTQVDFVKLSKNYKDMNIWQVGGDIRGNKSNVRNKDQHAHPSIWIIQDATRWVH